MNFSRLENATIRNNIIQDCSYGIYLFNSIGNLIYHNNFIDNTIQAYASLNYPNTWDDGYPSGGNYWSEYVDVDNSRGPYQNLTGSDGIWDNPYIINANNTDRYPFGTIYDDEPPEIGIPLRTPSGDVLPDQEVTIAVNVTDILTGVKNVTLYYTIDDGAHWDSIEMNYNPSSGLYEATIPGQDFGTIVKFKIEAFDNRENWWTKDGEDVNFVYEVVPEFPSALILPLFMLFTLIAVALAKKNGCKAKVKTI